MRRRPRAAWYDWVNTGAKLTEDERQMTVGGWGGLLRGREGELLLDLVFVFALTRFSERLVEDFTTDRRVVLPEVGQTALLLLALWLVWVQAAFVTSRYDTRQPVIQLLIVWTMFGSLIMAVALPHAFGARGVVFAVTYVAIQVGRPVIFLLTRHGPGRRRAARYLCWGAVSAVPWIAGAALFPQSPARGVLWTLAIALDCTGFVLGWPVPGLGRTGAEDWKAVGEHLAQRYQQFIIITIGETILLTGMTFANEFTPDRVLPTVVSFATAVLMWRIYFHHAGTVFPAAVEAASRPGRLSKSGFYTHLVMVTGILATGVGYALVIHEPRGHENPLWLAVIFGGPALFLVGRSRLEYEVFSRVSASRVVGLLALAALTPVMLHRAPTIATSAVAVVLAGVAVWDGLREWRRPDEAPSPLR
ncbi:low temperature requirement protein A [Micromonospora phytophila]|uniref:low temperature requirement protein A n=1 Tax=Micromonospora phytophila TaxID=709888 RepID=UPI0020308487|nr:low temperature requirement protein A [Micromonospora phytophila]MCM0675251.1 low temperature requirement protein A [Micromonospora phytophila]